MDAIDLLRADHQRVRNLFEQIRQADDYERKRKIFTRIKDELDLHAHLEETLFYPALSNHSQFKELVDESYDEHQDITDLLEEIDEIDGGDEVMLDDDIEELFENFEYHVGKEEVELFPKVRGVLPASQLQGLATVMQETRSKLAA